MPPATIVETTGRICFAKNYWESCSADLTPRFSGGGSSIGFFVAGSAERFRASAGRLGSKLSVTWALAVPLAAQNLDLTTPAGSDRPRRNHRENRFARVAPKGSRHGQPTHHFELSLGCYGRVTWAKRGLKSRNWPVVRHCPWVKLSSISHRRWSKAKFFGREYFGEGQVFGL